MEYTHIYIYTQKQSQNSPRKIKYSRLTWKTKEIKNFIYQLRVKLTKHKLENKTKARCQVGNKAMKTKLTNILRGKERNKEQICKVKSFPYFKILNACEYVYIQKKNEIVSNKKKDINS